jgi:hypothetical protein
LFGFESSFGFKDDLPLIGKMRGTNLLLTNWIEPSSAMETSLGDSLLSLTKLSFPDFTCSPLPTAPRARAPLNTHTTETMYEIGDLFLKLEFKFPFTFPTRDTIPARLEFLRNTSHLLKIKEFKQATLSLLAPSIVFGESSNGYHSPLFRDTENQWHRFADLERLSSHAEAVIGFKNRGQFMLRFAFSSLPFVNLLRRLEST